MLRFEKYCQVPLSISLGCFEYPLAREPESAGCFYFPNGHSIDSDRGVCRSLVSVPQKAFLGWGVIDYL